MNELNIRQDSCALDFLALGALVHRLDPGVIPFRKARAFDIHVSGGEYNVAAALADCFGMRTGIASAMVTSTRSQVRLPASFIARSLATASLELSSQTTDTSGCAAT